MIRAAHRAPCSATLLLSPTPLVLHPTAHCAPQRPAPSILSPALHSVCLSAGIERNSNRRRRQECLSAHGLHGRIQHRCQGLYALRLGQLPRVAAGPAPKRHPGPLPSTPRADLISAPGPLSRGTRAESAPLGQTRPPLSLACCPTPPGRSCGIYSTLAELCYFDGMSRTANASCPVARVRLTTPAHG